MTLQEKLAQTLRIKTAIKNAIVAKGVEIPESTPFSNYPAMIDEIGKPPWIQVTESNYFDYINTPFMYSWASNEEMAITAPTGEYPWIVDNNNLDSFRLEVYLPMDIMWFNAFNGERISGVGKHTLIVNRDSGSTNDWSKVSFGWGTGGTEFPSDNQPKVRIWVRIPEESSGPAVEYVTGTFRSSASSTVNAIINGASGWSTERINYSEAKKLKIVKNSILVLYDFEGMSYNIKGITVASDLKDPDKTGIMYNINIYRIENDFSIEFLSGTGEPT